MALILGWFGVPPSGGWKSLDRLKPELQTDTAGDFLRLLILSLLLDEGE